MNLTSDKILLRRQGGEFGTASIPSNLRRAPWVALVAVIATGAFGTTLQADSNKESLDRWVQDVHSANTLLKAGDLDRATAIYERTLDSARRAKDDLRIAVALQNLGSVFDRMGRTRDAERAYLQALASLSRTGKPEDQLTMRAYVGLVAVHIETEKYSKAEALIRRVLNEHPNGAAVDKAGLMGSLGVALAHRGSFIEAEQVLRSTAEACAANPDADMQEIGAIAIANLAGIQMRLGGASEGLASYRRALAIIESLPNPSPATLVVTLADYARAIRRSGEPSAAEALYVRAVDIASSRLGRKHTAYGRLLLDYAELLRDQGRKGESRKLVNTARRIQNDAARENMTGYTVEVQALRANR
jgi:tetratricopeptide (TPR) repeat protein